MGLVLDLSAVPLTTVVRRERKDRSGVRHPRLLCAVGLRLVMGGQDDRVREAAQDDLVIQVPGIP